MRLRSIALKNFKGIDNFSMYLNGGATSVYGDNATGKTTIADGFSWLLFGKDSLNSSVFEIKPIGKTGSNGNGLESSVEAVLDLGKREISLKKVYAEKWTKRRGAAMAEFTGHTTDHFVDGVPVKKKEFDETVKNLCDEDLFRLLTNPRHFNEVLHWQDRRKILLTVCGDITDADVIEANPQLSKLPGILGERKLEDHRKVIAARRQEINRELEKIPTRIDEISASRVTVVGDAKTINGAIKQRKSDRKKLAEELTQLQTGGEIASLTKQLNEVDAKIIALENKSAGAKRKASDASEGERRKLRKAVTDAEINMDQAKANRESLVQSKAAMESRIKEIEADLEKLRAMWHRINKEEFQFSHSATTCPTCGQELPEDQIDAAREKAAEDFNERKAIQLAANVDEGKSKSAEIKDLNSKVEEANARIARFDADLEKLKQSHKAAVETFEAFQPEDPEADPEIEKERVAMADRKSDILSRIKEARIGAVSHETALQSDIAEIDEAIEKLQAEILQIQANDRIDARVEELKNDERRLAAEYERLESEAHLTEEFVRAKVRALEEKINSKFEIARFKLFQEQINGGLSECCEVTHNGVPYGSMNNAARINVGLDICNTLSENFEVSLPCFIDNAESVTDLIPSASQMIRLVVSPGDKTLRIEG